MMAVEAREQELLWSQNGPEKKACFVVCCCYSALTDLVVYIETIQTMEELVLLRLI